ncbi:MAG: M81 family metallopeptidase [Dehalococcoidia bacterium]|jgi:microcystin degradation protein MlrC
MKFVIAQMNHETHTFVPELTRLEKFNLSGGKKPLEGLAAVETLKGGDNGLSAYVDIAESLNADYTVPIAAHALPSGPVSDEAFEYISNKITSAVKDGCDAVMLDLHGSMVTETVLDAEGELLERIRNVVPGIPIAVSLDFHCTITSKMVKNATVITVYRTIPHIDIYETASRAGKTLVKSIKGESNPVISAFQMPMMASLEKMSESYNPMKEIIDLIHELENSPNDILNASISGGHPYTDAPHGGMTAIFISDNNREFADTQAIKTLETAWNNRDSFVFKTEPIKDSIAHAKSLEEGPIIMADSGDIPSTGGYAADVTSLKEVIKQGFEDILVGPICDPESVLAMSKAGIGAEITLDLGGKTSVPSLNYKSDPIKITGKIKNIVDGTFELTGPFYRGAKMSAGLMAVLEIGSMDILITEQKAEAFDPEIYKVAGLNPQNKKYTLLKSRQHFRAAYKTFAKHLIRVSGPGITNPDFHNFPFKNIDSPMFPMDNITSFTTRNLTA